MSLFKSAEEKRKKLNEKINKNWHRTSEHKLGITSEESYKIQKKLQKALIDAIDEDGLLSDYTVINVLFPDLTPEQKVLILYYARWVESMNFPRAKIG